MRVLKGILEESSEYYEQIEREIAQKLSVLPKGSIKKRKIGNKSYYYLQFREGSKVVHKYLGRKNPSVTSKRLRERGFLEKELKKVKESRKMLKRVKGKKKNKK